MPARQTCGGQEVRQKPLKTGFAELAAQMGKLEQIVEIVNRVAERAHFAELLFGGLQVLLNFFELRESFLDVLIEFHLHLFGDGHQLGIDAIANRVEACAVC